METRTSQLIERLSEMSTREEIDLEVEQSYEELNESLSERGYIFEEGSGNFKGGQRILTRDLPDYSYYNELNYIKHGLNDEWIAMLDDYENYHEIENSINDITIKLF
jgi:hypothetical protein